jgi:hypothetical protein
VANPAIKTPMAMPLTIFSEGDIRVSTASRERAAGTDKCDTGAITTVQASSLLNEAGDRAFILILIQSSSTHATGNEPRSMIGGR